MEEKFKITELSKGRPNHQFGENINKKFTQMKYNDIIQRKLKNGGKNMEWMDFMSEEIKPENITNREQKEQIANQVAEKIKNGDVIGFGSGSSSYLAALAIAKRIEEEDLKILAIPTSYEMKMVCHDLKIPTTTILAHKPDWSFDGADEVEKETNRLIKGRGGAMFKEKLNMANSAITYILADNSKMVDKLGEKFSIPIEVFPEALNSVKEALADFGATEMILRKAVKKDGPVLTENNNFILDTKFVEIYDGLEEDIKTVTGVIESGLFTDYPVEILHETVENEK